MFVIKFCQGPFSAHYTSFPYSEERNYRHTILWAALYILSNNAFQKYPTSAPKLNLFAEGSENTAEELKFGSPPKPKFPNHIFNKIGMASSFNKHRA